MTNRDEQIRQIRVLEKMLEVNWDIPDMRQRINEDLSKLKGDVLQNEASNKKKDEDCFVASVIYGNSNAREVDVLRKYRDNVLMKDGLGRKFVEWYYDGRGERMAEFIENKAKFLIPIVRKGLDFIVEDYEIRKRS